MLAGLMAGGPTRRRRQRRRAGPGRQLKHFVANEQEIDRNNSSSNVDPRTLREIYTLPFEIAIDRGDAGGVMCSFNQVNHDPACGSEHAARPDPPGEIGFDGWVVTDFGARHWLTAGRRGSRAGLDQELNALAVLDPMAIKALIAAGTVTAADVDEAAYRVVRAHIASGLFDVPRPERARRRRVDAAERSDRPRRWPSKGRCC